MPKVCLYSDEAILQIIQEMEKNGEKVSLNKLAERVSGNRNRLHRILSDYQKKRLQEALKPLPIPADVLTSMQNWLDTERQEVKDMMARELAMAVQRSDEVAQILAQKESELEKVSQELSQAEERKKTAENAELIAEGKFSEAQRMADAARKEQSAAEARATAAEHRAEIAERDLTHTEIFPNRYCRPGRRRQ